MPLLHAYPAAEIKGMARWEINSLIPLNQKCNPSFRVFSEIPVIPLIRNIFIPKQCVVFCISKSVRLPFQPAFKAERSPVHPVPAAFRSVVRQAKIGTFIFQIIKDIIIYSSVFLSVAEYGEMASVLPAVLIGVTEGVDTLCAQCIIGMSLITQVSWSVCRQVRIR